MDNESKVRNERAKKLRRKRTRQLIISLIIMAVLAAGIWVYNYRMQNGIFPGDQLILTYESSRHPFSTNDLSGLIPHYFM